MDHPMIIVETSTFEPSTNPTQVPQPEEEAGPGAEGGPAGEIVEAEEVPASIRARAVGIQVRN